MAPVLRRAEVIVRQSRFWATNTTIVDSPAGCLLVDPGVYPDELRATARVLPGPVRAAVHTHAHWDHVLWAAELGAGVDGPVPRFVTGGTRTRLDRYLPDLRRHLDRLAADPGAGREQGVEATEPWDTASVGWGTALPDGAAVPWPGPGAVLLETGGHLPGHGSLHLPELDLLVAGDLLSDLDVPFPEEDPAAYVRAIDRLVALPRVATLVPGHGSPTDRSGLLGRADADRRYLERLAAVTVDSDDEGEALVRAAGIDERLADPAVRRGHEATVRRLLDARP
jgi:glyoxylase-like metal-dependent hydrolase (beta-lactamase superfamily II)